MVDNEDLQNEERAEQIRRLIVDFERNFKEQTSNADTFASLYEIEEMWGELRANTDKIYSDMLQDLMGKIDETELIRKKKRISGKRSNTAYSKAH